MAGELFKVGETYEFKMLDHEGEWTSWGEVEAVEGPLIKIKARPGTGETVVNTASPRFVSAEHKPKKGGA